MHDAVGITNISFFMFASFMMSHNYCFLKTSVSNDIEYQRLKYFIRSSKNLLLNYFDPCSWLFDTFNFTTLLLTLRDLFELCKCNNVLTILYVGYNSHFWSFASCTFHTGTSKTFPGSTWFTGYVIYNLIS